MFSNIKEAHTIVLIGLKQQNSVKFNVTLMFRSTFHHHRNGRKKATKTIRTEKKLTLKGGLFLFMYDIQHCFIMPPLDSTVSEDAGIEPRTVATTALAVRRSNYSARSHPN
jgi:hypothetical protein